MIYLWWYIGISLVLMLGMLYYDLFIDEKGGLWFVILVVMFPGINLITLLWVLVATIKIYVIDKDRT